MLKENNSLKGASAMEENSRILFHALKPPMSPEEVEERISSNSDLLARVASGDMQALDDYFALMGATKVRTSEPYFPE